MAEIFIPEHPIDAEDSAALLAREMEGIAQRAAWSLWLDTQSETIRALAAELETLKGARFKLSTSVDHRGRRLFVCSSSVGSTESRQSYEHALFLLVDSHRVRLEDRPETAERIRQLEGGNLKGSARRAQGLAKAIREKHPQMPGEERDKLLAAELDALEAERGRR